MDICRPDTLYKSTDNIVGCQSPAFIIGCSQLFILHFSSIQSSTKAVAKLSSISTRSLISSISFFENTKTPKKNTSFRLKFKEKVAKRNNNGHKYNKISLKTLRVSNNILLNLFQLFIKLLNYWKPLQGFQQSNNFYYCSTGESPLEKPPDTLIYWMVRSVCWLFGGSWDGCPFYGTTILKSIIEMSTAVGRRQCYQ